MTKVCFYIFAHSTQHTNDDVNDMIENIQFFHKNCDFMINHPSLNHLKIRTRHMPGILNQSNFIFGGFIELIESLTEYEINQFDHFCFVAANQYFINNIEFEPGCNYVQFYNTDNWDDCYTGHNFSTEYRGFPLQQPYGRWDAKDLYRLYDIATPMASNWECATLTREAMLLAKKHINSCTTAYPNQDMISVFPGYMALLACQQYNQTWKFPKHFGTYDPSNRAIKNQILFPEQVDLKRQEGYYSVKRVNYTTNCPIKQHIRGKYMI